MIKKDLPDNMLAQIRGRLVVSCQALEDEPLHSPFIMSRMALAAQQGGAAGIRASSVADVQAIQQCVGLPVIALIKRSYADSEVYITPTLKEVTELMALRPAMIVLDATLRPRPAGETLSGLVAAIRAGWPDVLLMADIATLEEAQQAEALGFDCIGTTLCGYTRQTAGMTLANGDYRLLREMLATLNTPVIAEGHIDTPAIAARCLALGAWSVVVGGAITRPQQITRRFVAALSGD
ncbi:N-acetylmannosamine-6-phosphate 2-epimerase [Entomohabitans teleogrylli]|uniref:N-acetylmannosamine-6-phosphate 2-epimerase n=1 Tax=Entomohabitans teleogrylli TaxID=1384589 RepID=UPI00073D5991|nr:N-acetylmannosamine-6-phosphate 2-epimerase [Entomohabitans teleogrylli]